MKCGTKVSGESIIGVQLDERGKEHKEDERLTLKGSQGATDQCHACGLAAGAESTHQCLTGLPQAAQSSYDVHIGAIVGDHYEILCAIGEGGMSVVYKARHQLLKKIVAIKVLKPHLSMDQSKLLRFQQEALSVSRLDHPNIIRVYDFCFPQDAEPFLIMDYVDGMPLSDLLAEEKTLSVERCVTIVSQVCDALAHAHEMGVVHRDIKPNNIMLCYNDDGTQTVKIVDFGIAKLVGGEGDAQNGEQSGEVFGSPLYMSPEQCAGKRLDARSDIYSLACVVYEAITGSPPLSGATPLDTIHMQVFDMPQGVSKLRPDLPQALRLDLIMFKALAKDPARRYPTMREFKADLEQLVRRQTAGLFRETQTHLAVYQAKQEASPKRRRTKPWVVAALTLSLFSLAAVSGMLIWQKSNVHAENDWPKTIAVGQAMFDAGQFADARRLFVSSLALAKQGESPVRRQERTIASLDQLVDLTRAEGNDPGSYSSQLDQAQTEQGLNDQCAELQNEIDRLLNAVGAADTRQAESISERANDLAVLEMDDGRFDTAERLLQAALKLTRRALTPGSVPEIRALCNLGSVLMNKSEMEEALSYTLQSADLARKTAGRQLELARGLNQLSRLYLGKRQPEEAERAAREAKEIFEREKAADSKGIALSQMVLAQVLIAEGNEKDAESALSLSLKTLENLPTASRDQQNEVICRLLLAKLFVDTARPDQAKPLMEDAVFELESIEAKTLTNWGSLAQALIDLSSLQLSSGNDAQARPLCLRALAIRNRICPTASPYIAQALILRARIDDRQHSPSTEKSYREALLATVAASDAGDPKVAQFFVEMSKMYLGQRHYAQAESVCRQGLALLSGKNSQPPAGYPPATPADAPSLAIKQAASLLDEAARPPVPPPAYAASGSQAMQQAAALLDEAARRPSPTPQAHLALLNLLAQALDGQHKAEEAAAIRHSIDDIQAASKL